MQRHNPTLKKLDPRSPLSVGNGEFAFTADITGLQTFPEAYEKAMPLCTQSQWGWHSVPPPAGLGPDDLKLEPYDTHGRMVGYPTRSKGQEPLFNWLRENPHRLHLGRVSFRLNQADISDQGQTLDLWTGIITSKFRVKATAVTVRTCCHPERDLLAVNIESAAPIEVYFDFPYGSPKTSAADWSKPETHKTTASNRATNRIDLLRELDGDTYSNSVAWQGLGTMEQSAPHQFVLRANNRLRFVSCFSAKPVATSLPSADDTFRASETHWKRFWNEGGAIELTASKDPRAKELERRIVLSQYQTAIQCSGSMPPQETGLVCNSWYGKFHLEMHWWHSAHFPMWSRTPLLEKSMDWYQRILPSARKKAKDQGYAGARWPKMVGPDGRDSPSPIGPMLIWQQPHPIAYAELCYQSHPNRTTLERYKDIVFESADFMASFAFLDPKTKRYVLGPPVIPAQENHPVRETWNPTYELGYWAHGLKIAGQWRQRLGLPPNPQWEQVRKNLAPMPVKEGVYLAHENCPQTFTERNRDHPSMLAAFGFLPGEGADRETMRRTLAKVFKEWRWADTWGWDYPMVAMTAARIGEPAKAIDALLLDTPKNEYLPNGHNYQRTNLPLYLPGNGGLLAAVAMMAAGWQGAPKTHAPGFPKAGWTVRFEGLRALL